MSTSKERSSGAPVTQAEAEGTAQLRKDKWNPGWGDISRETTKAEKRRGWGVRLGAQSLRWEGEGDHSRVDKRTSAEEWWRSQTRVASSPGEEDRSSVSIPRERFQRMKRPPGHWLTLVCFKLFLFGGTLENATAQKGQSGGPFTLIWTRATRISFDILVFTLHSPS